jgi:hypothetical protein
MRHATTTTTTTTQGRAKGLALCLLALALLALAPALPALWADLWAWVNARPKAAMITLPALLAGAFATVAK